MEVKVHKKKDTLGVIFGMAYVLFMLLLCVFKRYSYESFFLIIICFLVLLFAVYNISFDNKKIIINKEYIVVLLLGIIKIKYNWSDIKYLDVCQIKAYGAPTYTIQTGILCSKKTIKYYEITQECIYRNAVSYSWILLKPKSVILIWLNDLKPGQYEEFWSYVPDRLKGNFKSEEQ